MNRHIDKKIMNQKGNIHHYDKFSPLFPIHTESLKDVDHSKPLKSKINDLIKYTQCLVF